MSSLDKSKLNCNRVRFYLMPSLDLTLVVTKLDYIE